MLRLGVEGGKVSGVREMKPILFSGPMVKAILEGRKTQTRRVVLPSNSTVNGYNAVAKADALERWDGWLNLNFDDQGTFVDGRGSAYQYLHVPLKGDRDRRSYRVRCRFEPGDHLWVRETWCDHDYKLGGTLLYRADGEFLENWTKRGLKWKPSIFMPRWASRITLEITDVKVEKLQNISEEDAVAEGMRPFFDKDDPHFEPNPNGEPLEFHPLKGPLDAFRYLWESINGKKHPWASNPWVWAISFRRLEGK